MPLEWIVKYEPKTFDEMVLHPETKAQLARVLKKECSVTLYSKPGMGKGTFANVFLKETGCDHMWVNASQDNGIDFIRNQVEPFAYAGRGLSDKSKVCIFNEADELTPGAQKALKMIIEQSAKITLFWFLTNTLGKKINDAILSRAPVIEFKKPKESDIQDYVAGILRAEGVVFKKETLQEYIENQSDLRGVLNRVETAVVDGKLY
jgi:replication factor C small subunit